MDSTTFDTVARNLSTAVTRRSALRGLVAGALAVTVGSSALETSAKRRRKAKKTRTTFAEEGSSRIASRSVVARWTPSVSREPTAAMAISARAVAASWSKAASRVLTDPSQGTGGSTWLPPVFFVSRSAPPSLAMPSIGDDARH